MTRAASNQAPGALPPQQLAPPPQAATLDAPLLPSVSPAGFDRSSVLTRTLSLQQMALTPPTASRPTLEAPLLPPITLAELDFDCVRVLTRTPSPRRMTLSPPATLRPTLEAALLLPTSSADLPWPRVLSSLLWSPLTPHPPAVECSARGTSKSRLPQPT